MSDIPTPSASAAPFAATEPPPGDVSMAPSKGLLRNPPTSGVGMRPRPSAKSSAVTADDLSAADDEASPDSRSRAWTAGNVLAGKYTLLSPLGIGGMGVVWKARNESTAAEVAVKLVLPRTLADRDEIASRFRREAMATARLRHRSIVTVYDLVDMPEEEGNGCLALVMELLEGETLARLLERRSFLSPHEAVEIALALLRALAHAHQAGIVHRDLKPENVFLAVESDGLVTPKILDFGISKLEMPTAGTITRDGELLGTPSYMSPEQARSAEIDGRSDLFNIGILLYEMMTGTNPFAGEGLHDVIIAIIERNPPPLTRHGVSRELAAVVDRALAKDVDLRFRSAREMVAAIKQATHDTRQNSSPHLPAAALATGDTIPAPPADESTPGSFPTGNVPAAIVSTAYARGLMKRRRNAVFGIVGGVAALVVGIAVVSTSSGSVGTGSHQAATTVVGTTPTAPPLRADPGTALVAAAPAALASAVPAAVDAGPSVKGGAADNTTEATPSRPEAAPKASAPVPASAGRGGRGISHDGFAHDPGF